ncbi:MAG: excinuclease ABC subunit A [Deltaproteobacteria bacterium]|nr:excinuclease ABC subunit A [Deltaproteobacteria bacterium]
MAGKIVVTGARVHNLKNIDLEIPRDRLVVITGVSGSGKSSLAFDTLYAEGQRRYLESLGADARQLLKQLAKPDVDQIAGLSPAIAIQQKVGVANPRSTVGTLTDIYDFLRLLLARIGEPFCVSCGGAIQSHTIAQIVDQLLELPAQTRIIVLAPLEFLRAADSAQGLRELSRQGFARVMVDGQMHELSGEIPDVVKRANQLDLVVDRLVLREGVAKRLADSLEVAARAGKEIIKIAILGASENEPPRYLRFSQKLVCLQCGAPALEVTPSLFSFNSPQGACPSCHGLGIKSTSTKSLGERAPCKACHGSRLGKESLTVRLGGKNIAELAALSVRELGEFFTALELAGERQVIGQKLIAEISNRLTCLVRLGLDYLSLDRSAPTLSGGEAQRVRLATQMGASLAGVLYILDEPSIGLHQKDNQKLIEILFRLRDSGNSVIVVEHDPETILAADYVVDIGPGAGVHGGNLVASGTPAKLLADPRSLTGRYLSGVEKIALPQSRRQGASMLRLKNISARNLKNLTVAIPTGAMTCVTGVSGAGKSTLLMEVLRDGVAQRLQRRGGKVRGASEISGWENFDRVIAIDQGAIGRTPRSNPATFVGLYDHLRELFAKLPEARARGYQAERFSFNLRGGRCAACQGDGVTRVELGFLPELWVTCEVCRGRRYNRETLEVKYKGLSIADVLDLTVDQALELLNSIPPIHDRLRTLRDVGLGYLHLGQSATTLSGGEAQRVKLARELARRSTGRSLYILDEPTTGLHFADVNKLLELLNRLVELGNTMVIVEHNLDVIKCADHVIDLGPEGGAKGGEVLAQGTPEEIARVTASATGGYLKAALSNPAT